MLNRRLNRDDERKTRGFWLLAGLWECFIMSPLFSGWFVFSQKLAAGREL